MATSTGKKFATINMADMPGANVTIGGPRK